MGTLQSKRVHGGDISAVGVKHEQATKLSSREYSYSDKECERNSDRHPNTSRKSLSKFPGFFQALEKNESHVIVCYNTKGQLDYISNNIYGLLGYDPATTFDRLYHPIAPHQGAIYFRQHTNGSVVQFHNTFWSKSESGEMFSIDQPVIDTRATTMTLLIKPNGDIISCDGHLLNSKLEKDRDIVGNNLFKICLASHTSCISDAMSNTAYGKSSFSLYTKFTTPTSSRDVTMDFHPCVNDGLVVVSVSLVHDNAKDGDGAVTFIDQCITGTENNASDDETMHSLDLDVKGEQDPMKFAGNQVYHLGRRLREMNAEIQYLQDFRDNALLPMYSIIQTGEIVWANDAMITLMGYGGQKNQFLGSNAFDYHLDKDRIRLMCKLVLCGQTLNDFACNVIRKDGVTLNVTYNSNAKFDSNGVFSHSRCIVQDMTGHNRLQLERDNLEREKQLAEINEKEALLASRTKSDFLAVMSHEIRTPINGVIGASSLLSTTALDDEQLDYVKTISDSADILLSLIHNILDISKIEKGKFQLDKVSMRFVDLARECTDMMKHQAMDRGLSMVTTIGEELDDPAVWHHGDPTRLNQVLMNFLSNAVKFTHTGSVECKLMKVTEETSIRRGVHHSDSGRVLNKTDAPDDECDSSSISYHTGRSGLLSNANVDIIRLEVTDTGVGIADCSKLFSDFVQASSSVHQKYGGTGLGLSISKKIIHMMHGEVGMYSAVGVGTTVWAEIPLRRAPVPRKGPAFNARSDFNSCHEKGSPSSSSDRNNSQTIQRCPTMGDTGRAVRILIAEDNNVNQKVLKRLLQTLGYSDIDVAWNGQEALDAVKESWEKFLDDPREGRYDIVLMVRCRPGVVVIIVFLIMIYPVMKFITCSHSEPSLTFTFLLSVHPTGLPDACDGRLASDLRYSRQ